MKTRVIQLTKNMLNVVFYEIIYWDNNPGKTLNEIENVSIFISMGECPKGSLDGYLGEISSLSKIYKESIFTEIIEYLYQTLQGVSFMRKASILHRDIVRNVLLCRRNGR